MDDQHSHVSRPEQEADPGEARHDCDDVEPDTSSPESGATRDHAAEAADPSGDIASGGGEHPS